MPLRNSNEELRKAYSKKTGVGVQSSGPGSIARHGGTEGAEAGRNSELKGGVNYYCTINACAIIKMSVFTLAFSLFVACKHLKSICELINSKNYNEN